MCDDDLNTFFPFKTFPQEYVKANGVSIVDLSLELFST